MVNQYSNGGHGCFQPWTAPFEQYAVALELINVIRLWTWETAELANLEANTARAQKLAPKSRVLLGCFTASYDAKWTPWWAPLPVATMQRQCELALRFRRERRIEDLVIYGDSLSWLGLRQVGAAID